MHLYQINYLSRWEISRNNSLIYFLLLEGYSIIQGSYTFMRMEAKQNNKNDESIGKYILTADMGITSASGENDGPDSGKSICAKPGPPT